MKRHSRKASKAFTLLEMMLVVIIMGAISALMVPYFKMTETEVLDFTDWYNMGCTQRTLLQYYGMNGVFPDGWHTGLSANADASALGTGVAGSGDQVPINYVLNFANGGATQTFDNGTYPYFTATATNLTAAVNECVDLATVDAGGGISCLGSLVKAGILTLVYGDGTVTADVQMGGAAAAFILQVGTGPAYVATDIQYNAWVDDIDNPTAIAAGPGGYVDLTINSAGVDTMSAGYIVPLFAFPTLEWDKWYTSSDGAVFDDQGDSRIRGFVGRDPHYRNTDFSYYCVLFDVDDGMDSVADGEAVARAGTYAAKMIGIMSAQCIALNP